MKSQVNYLFIVLVIILTFNLTFDLKAENDGSFLVHNFDPGDYGGGSKIYSIVTNANGLMYAGDKDGIIEYDGENWDKIVTGFPIHSLALDKNNIVFVAGREGIGFLKSDSLNQLEYHSLNHLVTGYVNSNLFANAEVFRVDDEILFVVDNKLVIYSETKIRIIEGTNRIVLAQRVDDQLFIYTPKSGLFRYLKGEVTRVLSPDQVKGLGLWGLIESPGGLVIFGKSGSSYLLDNDKLVEFSVGFKSFIKEHFLQGIQQLTPESYVLKTFYGGLLLVNNNLEVVKQINQSGNLINNTVFGVDTDPFGNLWVGTSDGISVFRQSIPFTKYNTHAGIGSGYSAVRIGDNIFLGTSHGLYKKSPSSKGEDGFELIFPGHIFGLSLIDGVLYFGHPSGLYSLSDGILAPISRAPGGSHIKKIPFESNKYMSNTTDGLLIFSLEDMPGEKQLILSSSLRGKNREIHNFEFDTLGNVWVEYDNGIYSFNWERPEKKFYYARVDRENRIKKVRRVDNELYFIADSGVYLFNNDDKKFYIPEKLKRISNNNMLPSNIVCDNLGKIWIFSKGKLLRGRWDEHGLFGVEDPSFELINGSYPPEYEFVYSLNDSISLIGCEQGYIYYKDKKFSVSTYSSVVIRSVKISSPDNGKRRVWGKVFNQSKGYHMKLSEPVSYSDNSIDFVYSAGSPNYTRVKYQTFLMGFKTKWSPWSSENVKSYTNLPPGDYRFIVRAINNFGEYSYVGICDFQILPPWYLSQRVKFIYFFLSLFVVALIIFLVKYMIKRGKDDLRMQQKEEFERAEQIRINEKLQSEKEIIKLKNGQLRGDNLHKSKELANLTLNLIQKNQVLIDFKGELEQIKSYSECNKLVTEDLRRLIRRVNKDIDKEGNWEVFEKYFDTVHENFFIKLKKKFPELTSKDLRLSAYLRMNLSTKEIAPLMNITSRGVEIGRYRLRRKLDLERNVNINIFLQRL